MIIRLATPADVSAIERVVHDAYCGYIPRMLRKPGPMLDDYPARVRNGVAWVCEVDGAVAGLVVLLDEPDHLLLENIAVDPARHGTGVGRALLQFADAEALRRGYSEVRLYTHQSMIENIALYARIGYHETGRREHEGFRRVFFTKRLPTPEK
jgi:ribosomal protein S18 acetylase RimI-like enzyme